MAREDCVSFETQVIEDQMISFFQDGVKMLGLPKSIGEIYGVLFCAQKPMTMIEIIKKSSISKGSTSQGLRMLRSLGAITETKNKDDRKTYFTANVELKKIVGGFIREEIRPHLNSGKDKLKAIHIDLEKTEDRALKDFYEDRINRLDRWLSKAGLVLPLLQKFLRE